MATLKVSPLDGIVVAAKRFEVLQIRGKPTVEMVSFSMKFLLDTIVVRF